MKRWLFLPALLLVALAIAAYPRLHKRLLRFQSHQAAEAAIAQIAPQLTDFDLGLPTVQAKLRERYGNRLPLLETVISPASIFRSPELVTVLSR